MDAASSAILCFLPIIVLASTETEKWHILYLLGCNVMRELLPMALCCHPLCYMGVWLQIPIGLYSDVFFSKWNTPTCNDLKYRTWQLCQRTTAQYLKAFLKMTHPAGIIHLNKKPNVTSLRFCTLAKEDIFLRDVKKTRPGFNNIGWHSQIITDLTIYNSRKCSSTPPPV